MAHKIASIRDTSSSVKFIHVLRNPTPDCEQAKWYMSARVLMLSVPQKQKQETKPLAKPLPTETKIVTRVDKKQKHKSDRQQVKHYLKAQRYMSMFDDDTYDDMA